MSKHILITSRGHYVTKDGTTTPRFEDARIFENLAAAEAEAQATERPVPLWRMQRNGK